MMNHCRHAFCRNHTNPPQKRFRQKNIHQVCLVVIAISTVISYWFQTGILFGQTSSSLMGTTTTTTTTQRHLKIPDVVDGGRGVNSELDSITTKYLQQSVQIRRRHRPLVAHDEFVYKVASSEVIDDFFHFETPSTTELERHFQNGVLLQPMWTCSMKQRLSSSKLIYLQVFRSGGSTIRALLKVYRSLCHVGIATVSHCLDLGYPSIVTPLENQSSTSTWYNSASQSPHFMSECQLTELEERNGTRHEINLKISNPLSTYTLEKHGVDILAGRLPLGSGAFWTDAASNRRVDARYLIFFRDPLSRFVSQFLTSPPRNKNHTLSVLLSNMYSRVRTRMAQGEHQERLSNFLITPEQRYWAEQESVQWNLDRQVNLSKSNLVQNNVVVGILERLRQSLQLVQHVIDGENQLSTAFKTFSSTTGINSIASFNMKQSRERTKAVVQAIQANATFQAMMDEYLQYEYEIYNFALYLNTIQCRLVHNTKWNAQ